LHILQSQYSTYMVFKKGNRVKEYIVKERETHNERV